MKRITLLILFLLFTLSAFSQMKKDTLQIIFKPKSTKLTKIEKEKIRKFVEICMLDTIRQYKIYSCGSITNPKMESRDFDRISAVIHYFETCGIDRGKFIITNHGNNCAVTNNILIQKLYTEYLTPQPLPNTRK